MTTKIISPDWPAPSNIHAYTTTQACGNLAIQDRDGMLEFLNLPSRPIWLKQVHGIEAVEVEIGATGLTADASFSRQAKTICVVLTADCLPVLITNTNGDEVAAIHAGWRGLSNGVIEATVTQLESPRSQLLAWMGPAIGPAAFEVGPEVRQAFLDHDPAAAIAFAPSKRPDHFMANLYQLARQRLQALGISQIFGGDYCTYSQTGLFYSYRRAANSGRMASLIWFD